MRFSPVDASKMDALVSAPNVAVKARAVCDEPLVGKLGRTGADWRIVLQ